MPDLWALPPGRHHWGALCASPIKVWGSRRDCLVDPPWSVTPSQDDGGPHGIDRATRAHCRVSGCWGSVLFYQSQSSMPAVMNSCPCLCKTVPTHSPLDLRKAHGPALTCHSLVSHAGESDFPSWSWLWHRTRAHRETPSFWTCMLHLENTGSCQGTKLSAHSSCNREDRILEQQHHQSLHSWYDANQAHFKWVSMVH